VSGENQALKLPLLQAGEVAAKQRVRGETEVRRQKSDVRKSRINDTLQFQFNYITSTYKIDAASPAHFLTYGREKQSIGP
jgi:hypothetical protein